MITISEMHTNLLAAKKRCSVSKYNELELHEHMRLHHQPEFVFRCNKCVKVFRTRPQLHQHHEVEHGRVKLTDVKGEKCPCLRCKTEFLNESIFVAHSREHEENIHGCNECLWHFNTVAGLIKHCRDTHDTRYFACTLLQRGLWKQCRLVQAHKNRSH